MRFTEPLTNKPDISDSELRDSMLNATRTFPKELGMDDDDAALRPSSKCTEGRANWISWKLGDTVRQGEAAVAGTHDVGPVVIEYDEISGVAGNQQVDSGSGIPKGCPKSIALP